MQDRIRPDQFPIPTNDEIEARKRTIGASFGNKDAFGLTPEELDSPISALGAKARTQTLLEGDFAGYKTIGEILEKSEQELYQIPGFGPGTFDDLCFAFYKHRIEPNMGKDPRRVFINIPDGDTQGYRVSQEEYETALGLLSEKGKETLAFAKNEARRYKHNYVGTEHLLMGLTEQIGTPIQSLLHNRWADADKVRKAVEFIIRSGDYFAGDDIGLTSRAKKVMVLSADEARRHNAVEVEPEHILLGLVREGEGIAAGVMESLGFDLGWIRKVVISYMVQEQRGQQEFS